MSIDNSFVYYFFIFSLLFLEYRGYGLSSGTPGEKGLYIDARAAVDYLFTRHDLDHSQIVLFGRSLGGAVVSADDVINLHPDLMNSFQVIDVAADSNYGSKVMCSVVENTFTSIPHMARHLISYVKYVPLICHKNRVRLSVLTKNFHLLTSPPTQFTSIDKVQKISTPILFISGLNDSLVPSSMMSLLHSQCKSSRKQLFQLSGGGHMDTWNANG